MRGHLHVHVYYWRGLRGLDLRELRLDGLQAWLAGARILQQIVRRPILPHIRTRPHSWRHPSNWRHRNACGSKATRLLPHQRLTLTRLLQQVRHVAPQLLALQTRHRQLRLSPLSLLSLLSPLSLARLRLARRHCRHLFDSRRSACLGIRLRGLRIRLSLLRGRSVRLCTRLGLGPLPLQTLDQSPRLRELVRCRFELRRQLHRIGRCCRHVGVHHHRHRLECT